MNLELKQNSDVVLTKIERTLVIKVQLYVRMPLSKNKETKMKRKLKNKNSIDTCIRRISSATVSL